MHWQCQPKAPQQPVAPVEKYLYSDMQIQNEKHISVLNVPVEMPIAEFEKQINAQLQGLIYEDNSYEDEGNDNLKAKVWKLNDIRVTAQDSTFFFDVPLRIWVSAGYKVSPLGFTMSGYMDTEFSLRIRFLSKVGVTPDWRVTTHTYVDSYDWISEPSIKVAGLTIPIKAMVSRLLNKNFEKITKAIDEQVSKNIDLKKYVQQAWDLARQPRLMSEEYQTWLVVVPTSVIMTPLAASNGLLKTTIGLKGYTQTVTASTRPETSADSKLPPLQMVDRVPDNFRVGLISRITYRDAARLASQKLVGETFKFSGDSYTVQITSIDMYGQDDKLIIKAGLKGSLNGYIYLRGLPHYDPETQLLSLKDMDYDLDTQNVIFRTASWLLQSTFSRMIQKRMVFPVGVQIAEARNKIQQALTHNLLSKGIDLNGTLNEIIPDRVYLTPGHIYSVVFATGKVNLRIEGLI